MDYSKGLYLVSEDLRSTYKDEGFNTITMGDPSQVDLNKQNIYPLLHMSLLSRVLSENTEVITMQLIWLDSVYSGKPLDTRTTPDQFSNIDNTEDVFQDLAQRIHRGYLKYLKTIDLKNIEVSKPLTLNAFYAKAQNKLAGYEATISLTIPSVTIC